MYNDYELLYLAKEDIETIINILYKKYKHILYHKAIKYSSNINLEIIVYLINYRILL